MSSESQEIRVRMTPEMRLDLADAIPETISVTVEENREGVPLATLVKRFGGYEGAVTDAFGQQRKVSLAKWRDRDSRKTRLVLAIRYQVRREAP